MNESSFIFQKRLQLTVMSRASQAQKKTNGKYEAILRSAIKVFASSGFFNSKVSDVAREAGVADGTVYLYFKNKDDILVSIFNHYMEEALAAGKASLEKTDDPIEKLRRIVCAHLQRLGRDRNLAIGFLLGRGSFRAGINTKVAAKVLFGALDEMATNWVLSHKRYNLLSTARPLLDVFLNGIGRTHSSKQSD